MFNAGVADFYKKHSGVVNLPAVMKDIQAFIGVTEGGNFDRDWAADAIMEELAPDGCGVVIEATHTCMTIRGIQKPGSTMITSAMRGGFRRRPETRAEFFANIKQGF